MTSHYIFSHHWARRILARDVSIWYDSNWGSILAYIWAEILSCNAVFTIEISTIVIDFCCRDYTAAENLYWCVCLIGKDESEINRERGCLFCPFSWVPNTSLLKANLTNIDWKSMEALNETNHYKRVYFIYFTKMERPAAK